MCFVVFFFCELLYNHETKTASSSALTSSKSGAELTAASAEIIRFLFRFASTTGVSSKRQAPAVRRLDNAIHWINRYLFTYPPDSDLTVE